MYHTKKRIKGKHYWYLQRSRRIPGRKNPKTESWYVGPVGAAFSVIRIGVALATKQAARDKVFGDLPGYTPANEKPVEIGGLGVSKNWTAEQSFQHESGLMPSASAAPPSDSAGASGSGGSPQ